MGLLGKLFKLTPLGVFKDGEKKGEEMANKLFGLKQEEKKQDKKE